MTKKGQAQDLPLHSMATLIATGMPLLHNIKHRNDTIVLSMLEIWVSELSFPSSHYLTKLDSLQKANTAGEKWGLTCKKKLVDKRLFKQ